MFDTNIIFRILITSCWIVLLSESKLRDTSEIINYNQEEQMTALNRYGVCLTVWTRLHADMWDDVWLDNFFDWMKNGFLQSIARQCTSDTPCPLLAQSKVILRIDGKNHLQNKKLIDHIENLDTNILYYHKSDKKYIEKQMVKMIAASKCSWVSYVWIDADDIFLDGFFKYVTTEIPRLVIQGRVWRGALFIPQVLPNIVIGNGKCTVKYFEEYESLHTFFCGLSPGQGFVLRREVWDALSSKVVPYFLHPAFLKVVRNFVMHGLGFDKYTSGSCGKGHFWLGNGREEEVWAYEERDASDTNLFLIDLTRNWTTSGIKIHTPFSGHFPWGNYNELPACTFKQKVKIMRNLPSDVRYMLKAASNIKITMEEACNNNRYMADGVRKHTRCKELLPTFSNDG